MHIQGTITLDELQDNIWDILAEFFTEINDVNQQ